MKTKALLVFLFISLEINSLYSQTYNPVDTAALRAIDRNCDQSNMLNWNTEPDPANWNMVTWNNSAPKRVSKLILNSDTLNGVMDVSPLSELDTLYCNYNQLTGLNVSGLTNLKYLSCYANQLTNLNASGLINLQTLYCSNNKLTGLDLSGLTNLQYIICSDNQLKILDVSDQTDLRYLECPSNQLTSLNVSGSANLRALFCYSNQLISMDVSGDTSLRTLFCYSNQLTSLDVSDLINLETLNCYSNQLTNLDLTGLNNLRYLNCDTNRLGTLNVIDLTNLYNLCCNSNQLTSLDVTGLNNLLHLNCSSNQLTSMDVSGLINLITLNCSFNQLTNLNVSNLTNLETFDCSYNRLNYLDASKLIKLNPLHCEHNRLPFSSLAKRSNSNYFYIPQDTLFTPLFIASIYTIDYSAEALIKSTRTNFEFYKNDTLVATNTTGLYNTKGSGVYYCKMTNSWFGALTLVTAPVTITNAIPALSVSPSVLDIAAGANSTDTFNITSNIGWIAASSATWLTVSPASGSNNEVVILTAAANTTNAVRSGWVLVIATGVAAKYVTVTQAALSLSVSRDNLTLSAGATSADTFTIKSNTDWSVTCSETWLTVSPASGSNNGVVTLTAIANTNATARITMVIVSGTNGTSQTVTITQTGAAQVLSVSPATFNISAEANNTATLNIISNTDWSVVSSDTWLSVSPAAGSNNGAVTLMAGANTSSAARTATVTISVTGLASQTVTVTQIGTALALLVSSSILSVNAAANSTATFDIASNIAWSVISSESWLTLTPASGSNNGTVTLTASANPGTTVRTATVTISGTGVASQTITVTQAANNTTAIAEITQNNECIYPNPVKDKVNVRLAPADLPATIGIYNMEGKQLIRMKANTSLTEIEMEGYAPGVYILRIMATSRIIDKKILKQ